MTVSAMATVAAAGHHGLQRGAPPAQRAGGGGELGGDRRRAAGPEPAERDRCAHGRVRMDDTELSDQTALGDSH